MEVLDVIPEILKKKRIPWGEINIMPIGDIQYGAEGCDVDRLKRHLKWGVDHNVWFIGMGDYHDFLSPSNRRILKTSGLYDTAQNLIEQWYGEHLLELQSILEPTKDRWLGMLSGHHYFEFSDGTTTDTRLCQFLNTNFLGTCGYLTLTFEDHAKHVATCKIWCHHGTGSGSNASSALNKLEKIAGGFDAHIYLMGHQSKLGYAPLDYLDIVKGKDGEPMLIDRTKALVATGSFMRGYQAGSRLGGTGRPSGSYVEQAMMTPAALGGSLITVTPRRKDTYTEIDIKVSM